MSDSGVFLLLTNKLYKKENTKRLKNFPAGYVGSFYRNLAENIDIDTTSNFYSRIAADADIPREDVQMYILTISDFAKSIQADINHYVTRDRINDASFRQRLDPISKNILRRYFEKVFEDISTFDAENPIVGSLLREININKKQSDSDFIISLPSHPGPFVGGQSLFENDLGAPPSLPTIEDFLDGGPRPLQPPPQPPRNIGSSLFETSPNLFQPPQPNSFDLNDPIVRPPTKFDALKGIGNTLFGS